MGGPGGRPAARSAAHRLQGAPKGRLRRGGGRGGRGAAGPGEGGEERGGDTVREQGGCIGGRGNLREMGYKGGGVLTKGAICSAEGRSPPEGAKS